MVVSHWEASSLHLWQAFYSSHRPFTSGQFVWKNVWMILHHGFSVYCYICPSIKCKWNMLHTSVFPLWTACQGWLTSEVELKIQHLTFKLHWHHQDQCKLEPDQIVLSGGSHNDPVSLTQSREDGQTQPRIYPLTSNRTFSTDISSHIVDGIIFLQNRIVIPMGLRNAFLQKIHDTHLGIVKSKLLGWTLVYWPNWNSDVEMTCQNCILCRENQSMPMANIPKFQVKANSPGEIYGIDVVEIHSKSHIVCVNYYTCCIFERELWSLHSTDVIDALKSIFYDIGAPD